MKTKKSKRKRRCPQCNYKWERCFDCNHYHCDNCGWRDGSGVPHFGDDFAQMHVELEPGMTEEECDKVMEEAFETMIKGLMARDR